MLNNFIPIKLWKQEELENLDCLYGYSHKFVGYLPFKEINDIVKIGNTSRLGIKGIDEYDEKLYIQLSIRDQKAILDKNWLDLEKFGFSSMKIISNPKITRWDRVKLNIKPEEINTLEIEGVIAIPNSYEIDIEIEFIFLGHLKENANKIIMQHSTTKAIYLISKEKIKKV